MESVSYTGFKWDETAGSLKDYFYDEGLAVDRGIHMEKSFDEIMNELGLSKEESKHLYSMLYFQHAISGTDLPINSYNDETLKEYANNVEQNYKKNNRNISSKEIQETAKNMYRKADYTHQSITMATHVSPRGLF